MCGVFATDMAQAVAAWHRTPAGSRGKTKKKKGEEKVWKAGKRYGEKESDGAQRLDKENQKELIVAKTTIILRKTKR